jgi:hypothetical protein
VWGAGEVVREGKQQAVAEETLAVWCSMAASLGWHSLKVGWIPYTNSVHRHFMMSGDNLCCALPWCAVLRCALLACCILCAPFVRSLLLSITLNPLRALLPLTLLPIQQSEMEDLCCAVLDTSTFCARSHTLPTPLTLSPPLSLPFFHTTE